jgi:transcriptional regulator with GAF, ATPase, and Fis domain
MRGLVIYPLIAGEQWIGILMAMSNAPLDLRANEIRQIAGLTGQASAVIQTMRLVEQSQRALGLTEELYAGSERVVHSTTHEELLHALVRSSVLQELDQASLLILDRPLGQRDTASTGVTPTAFWQRADLPAEQSLDTSYLEHALENLPIVMLLGAQQPLIIQDTTTDERLDENMRQTMNAVGARSVIVLPLVVGGQTIGGVIARGGAATEMREGQVRRMTSLAEQAATVLQSQLLFDQTQAALVETQVLHQAGAELNAARSYEEILTVLRNHTVLGQADRLASIDLFDRPWVEDDWPDWVIVIVRWPKLSRQQAEPRYLTQDFPSLFELLRQDEAMFISDVESDPRLDDNLRALFLERFQARSSISIPLMVGGQWLGYVNGQYKTSTHFSENEIRRLTTLTAQAAVAVQSLRQLEDIQARVQREQQLREITARLRTPPDVDGVMRVLAQELGQVLGRRTAVRLNRQEFMNVAAADQQVASPDSQTSRDTPPSEGRDGGRS